MARMTAVGSRTTKGPSDRSAQRSTPRRTNRWINGWILVGWCALVLSAMALGILAAEGAGEDGVRGVIRATARTSLVLFLLAYIASSLRRTWRAPATAWLLRNRRQAGVSFAVSHGLHGVAIGALWDGWPEVYAANVSPGALYGGLVGYAFIAAMAATSSDRAVAWLGPVHWRRLHRTGIHVLWAIFFLTYVPMALLQPSLHAALLATAVLAAGGLRLVVYARGRRRASRARAQPSTQARVQGRMP
jgi:sulfoxide reductase heme-binding subunit YedZ